MAVRQIDELRHGESINCMRMSLVIELYFSFDDDGGNINLSLLNGFSSASAMSFCLKWTN